MRTMTGLFSVCALLAQQPAPGQDAQTKSKGDPLILKPARTIEFTTDEATWMNLDVSPDGTMLLADVLGDLYTLWVTGGEMKLSVRILFCPRWSCGCSTRTAAREVCVVADRGMISAKTRGGI